MSGDDFRFFVGDAPMEETYAARMKALARFLDEQFNGRKPDDPEALRGWLEARATGFLLLVFPLNADGGRVSYISNANRDDMVRMFRQQLEYFESLGDRPEGRPQ